MTTATATKTFQANDLIGLNNRAARATRFLMQNFDVACQTATSNFEMKFRRQRKSAEVNHSFSAFT